LWGGARNGPNTNPICKPKPTWCGEWEESYNETREWVNDIVRMHVYSGFEGQPILGENVNVTIGGEIRYIVSFCAWMDPGITQVILGYPCADIPGKVNDNCDHCPGLDCPPGHYIWAIGEHKKVYSTCVGDDCWANNEDGFQGVWP
jgi:hypothetical protein